MRALALALGLALAAGAAWGQEAGVTPPDPQVIPDAPDPALAPSAAPAAPRAIPMAVVVLDRDALFARSRFGQRVRRDIEVASEELSAENRRIEAALEAEERTLTAQRETMEAAEFRALAQEFDARVEGIRRAQDAKARAIQQQSERAQAIFFERSNPVLIEIARQTGALVILDRRTVIASADQVDITEAARAAIDASLGEGDGLVRPAPAPRGPAAGGEASAPPAGGTD
jgi:Skp family chaperone for outer membrane proteins